jgi:hypothetical protein
MAKHVVKVGNARRRQSGTHGSACRARPNPPVCLGFGVGQQHVVEGIAEQVFVAVTEST